MYKICSKDHACNSDLVSARFIYIESNTFITFLNLSLEQ